MSHLNKPLAVRTALGLSPTDAGRVLLGIANHKRAYDTWAKMERDNSECESLSNSMRQYLNLLLMLSVCRTHHTPGAYRALDLFIEQNNA